MYQVFDAGGRHCQWMMCQIFFHILVGPRFAVIHKVRQIFFAIFHTEPTPLPHFRPLISILPSLFPQFSTPTLLLMYFMDGPLWRPFCQMSLIQQHGTPEDLCNVHIEGGPTTRYLYQSSFEVERWNESIGAWMGKQTVPPLFAGPTEWFKNGLGHPYMAGIFCSTGCWNKVKLTA